MKVHVDDHDFFSILDLELNLKSAAERLSNVKLKQTTKDLTEKIEHVKAQMRYIIDDLKEYRTSKHDKSKLDKIIDSLRKTAATIGLFMDDPDFSLSTQNFLSTLTFGMDAAADKLECLGPITPTCPPWPRYLHSTSKDSLGFRKKW